MRKLFFALAFSFPLLVGCGPAAQDDDATTAAGDDDATATATPSPTAALLKFASVDSQTGTLVLPGGLPFIPVGHNDKVEFSLWSTQARLDAYFAYMASHGENVLRVVPDINAQNRVESEVGVLWPAFTAAMDALLLSAEAHGIYLVVALYPNFGADPTIWAAHPYNTAVDFTNGLVSTPRELLTDPTAIAACVARATEFATRWGGSPAILAWELWAGLDSIGLPADPDRATKQGTWIQAVGESLRSTEEALYGEHHLRMASVGNGACCSNMSYPEFDHPELDLTAYQTYDPYLIGGIDPHQGNTVLPLATLDFLHHQAELAASKSPSQPHWDIEDEAWSTNPAGGQMFPQWSADKIGDLFIAGEWSSYLAGSLGLGLRLPCKNPYLEDGIDGYRALSVPMFDGQEGARVVLDGVDWAGAAPSGRDADFAAESPALFRTWALGNGSQMLGWIHSRDTAFNRSDRASTVDFSGLESRAYSITWFDPRDGSVLGSDSATGPAFTLSSPTFQTFALAWVE